MSIIRTISVGALLTSVSACATIVNDAEVPVSLSFSDASSGACNVANTRVSKQVAVPSTSMIRRARSGLNYNCQTKSGKTAVGTIPSSIEGAKLGASVLFLDLGITDSITEKARTYPSSFVIPVH